MDTLGEINLRLLDTDDPFKSFIKMPDTLYHSIDPTIAVNHSTLSRVGSEGAFNTLNAQRSEPTPAMKFGTAFHMLLLEPEKFDDHYIESPEFDRRTKAGKQEFAEWAEANKDKEPIKAEDMTLMRDMAERIQVDEDFNHYLKDMVPEATWMSYDDEFSIWKRCKTDIWKPDTNTIIDIKTCVSAHPKAIQKSIVNFNYDTAAAFYCDIVSKVSLQPIEDITFLLISVEKSLKGDVLVTKFNNLDFELIRLGYRSWLSDFCDARDLGCHKGFGGQHNFSLNDVAFRRKYFESFGTPHEFGINI